MNRKKQKKRKLKTLKSKKIQKHTQPLKKPHKKKPRFLLKTWQLILGIGTFCSILSFAFLLIPRVSIEIGPSLNPSNQFKNIIYVYNNGYFQIVNVEYKLKIEKARTNNQGQFSNVSATNLLADKIPANQKSAIEMERAFQVPDNFFISPNVVLEVKYMLWPIRIKCVERCRINIKNAHDGKYILFISQP